MKRRVFSFVTALALCLNLCPAWAFAAVDATDAALCTHHPAHTDACGYAASIEGHPCGHEHTDDCYIEQTQCVHVHDESCFSDGPVPTEGEDRDADACEHVCTEDSGCITRTLSCTHEHDDTCGYAPGTPGAACTFVCRICPIEDLIGALPDSVSADNSEQVGEQLGEIFDLYDALTEEEQGQVDLSPCAALMDQLEGLGAEGLSDSPPREQHLSDNEQANATRVVSYPLLFDTKEFTLTNTAKDPNSTAIQVTGTGELELRGKVVSQFGIGVRVESGGSLTVTGENTSITSQTYALDIASGATVQLSAGTYTGGFDNPAIRVEDGNFAALLAKGFTFFDTAGNLLSPDALAKAETLTVGRCENHAKGNYTAVSGTPAHTWTCSACETSGTEKCTFDFVQDGDGTSSCGSCGNKLVIVVDENDLADLVYDGTVKPEQVGVTVTLTDPDGKTTPLTKGTDFSVNIEKITDAGQAKVTVTGITFNGTFVKTYTVEQDKPGLSWANSNPVTVNYDGQPVEANDLPAVKINIQSQVDDLRGYLQYSHKKQGDTDYISGLPKDAGTYDVIVSLPELPNFEGAVSDPITLTINQIAPIVTAPAATKPTYNRSPQELVTAGELNPVAMADGLEIQFATSQTGPWSATIPTGTTAGAYNVWYKLEMPTEVAGNYITLNPNPAQITGVEIQRKAITPVVTLSQYSYLYDGGYKEPTVTVKDVDRVTDLPDTEYKVEYVNNRNVSTDAAPAKVVVTDKIPDGGNYDLTQVEVEFKITSRTQEALSITNQPSTFTYGDKFVLGTSGGSGNGLVTWEIVPADPDNPTAVAATVDANSGQVTITGHGSVTVKATKSGRDPDTGVVNYEDATASLTFTAVKKPVTATVTAEDKDYDGDAAAIVHAVVESGVLPGDVITIENLTGTFDDENAGEDKTVTVDTTGATITGNNSQHYAVSYSSTTVKATIHKAVAQITAAPVPASLTYNGTAQKLIGTAAVVDPADVPVEYALSEDGPYSTDFPKATNAGKYTVWYRIQDTDNYTGLAPASIRVTIAQKPVNPTITLSGDGLQTDNTTTPPTYSYVYDGTEKTPTVTLYEAGGTTLIPAGEYTVAYSNNINVSTADTPATVTVTAKDSGNYTFENAPVTENFTINQKQAKVLTAPEAAGDPLTFNTRAQKLVTAGTAEGGTMVYSTDGENGTYSENIPTKTDAAEYTVHYKVQGDGNHSDSAVGHVEVTIAPKTVKDPTIELYQDDGTTPLVSYAYDGRAKEPKVVVKDGSTVIKGGADGEYNVVYSDNTDAGHGTVNITDKPGGNYDVTGSKTFVIDKADITFTRNPSAATLTYNGKAQELLNPGEFSGGTIQYALSSPNSTYTDAIPTGVNAGTYNVYYKVTGDKNHNDLAAQSVPVTINKATAAIAPAPAKIDPLTYTGQPQALVTAGAANVGFLVYSLDGTDFSREIPTGTDAGDYTVYYKVDETDNYTGVAANTTPISVTIDPKSITPKIELSETSFKYDGNKKSPKITLKDGDTVIPESQYTVTWAGTKSQSDADLLRVVDTYTATIKSVTGGNYTIDVTASVEITPADQAALTITGQPEHVYYGDVITTLGTTGGTGDGTVKWSVTTGGSSAEIDPDTGKLTITGVGAVTVRAERTVPNYGSVGDNWNFTVEPKPVTAEVTVASKDYDGNKTATVASVTVPTINGDTVSVGPDSITATFDDPNAGTGKTVTLDATNAAVSGTDAAKYTVSYPATAKGNINPKHLDSVTVTLSDHDLKSDANGQYYDFDGTEKKPKVTVKYTKDGTDKVIPDSNYTVEYANNKNVSTVDVKAAVTVTNAQGGNYTFTAATVNFEIRSAAAALVSSPLPKDLTYEKGKQQELVTVGTATGGTVVYALKTGATEPADTDYSTDIPTGENAGTYTVYYMVKGDSNHASTTPQQMTATIKPKEITPTITLDTISYVYDGAAKTPTATVMDGTETIDATEYSVSYRDNVNVGTATVVISDANGGNYIVNGTATFEITKAAPAVTAPTGKTGLQYTGEVQELVKAGGSSDGTVVYSVNGGNYSAAIPSASAVDTYTIDWKVQGDGNHSDTTPATLTVNIAKNTVNNPVITLSQDQFTFDNNQHKPDIAVYDNNSRLIPPHEYTVSISGTNGNVGMVDVDTYTVTIAAATGSNYEFTGTLTRTFKIVPADQETISITGTQAQVRYGDTIQLGVTGGTGSGTVTWKIAAKDGSTTIATGISATGLLTVKDVNTPITVTVTRSRDNYSDVSASWEFTAGKKPVTAVLTGVDKPFDGNATATVKAKVDAGDLVFGDTFSIPDLTGTFDNANVGTNKTITITGSAPTITDPKAANYEITYPATATASILGVAATVDTEPAANTLTYDASQAQALVTAGSATGGTMVYSLDGTTFTLSIPTGKDAGDYKVYFKAQGDQNHTDSAVGTVDVTIAQQTIAATDLQIELSPPSGQYDGKVQQPEVTVRDTANNVIPDSEYKVTYVTDGGKNWKDQGTYTVKVENITGGNYIIAEAEAEFKISTTAQAPFEIVNKPGLVYYGDTFTLSATGGSGSEAVTWSSSNMSVATVTDGTVTVISVGSATITATKAGGGNYDTATATYPLNALKKPATVTVTAEDKVYDGKTDATIHVTWNGLVGSDEINTDSLTGAFEDANVGANKTVTITGTPVSDATSQKYDFTIPGTTTASITKAVATAPNVTANDRVYDGTAKDLVTGGNTGTTLYSASRDGVYSDTVPTGTNAGTYTVWYKAQGDANHNESAPQAVEVTISPKTLTLTAADIKLSGNDLKTDTSGSAKVYYYEYDGADKTPFVVIEDGAATIPSSEYTVTYSDNRNVTTADKKATVTITDNEGGNYTVSGSTTFEIRRTAAQLTGAPQDRNLTYNGAAQQLVTVGTATGGHIEYKLTSAPAGEPTPDSNFSTTIPTGTNAGTYTVEYKLVGDDNHTDGESGSITVTIQPKTVVSPKITVTGTYTYDGTEQKPTGTAVTVEDGDVTIPASEYTLSYRDNVNVGTATVIVSDANGGNYTVNGTATFEIGKAAATVGTPPEGKTGLHYNGSAQELLATQGTATGGTMVYSLDENGEYSAAIPTGKAVDEYEIWYMVQGDANHSDTTPVALFSKVKIDKNTVTNPTIQVTPASVKYTGEKQEPIVTVKDDAGLLIDGSEYKVTYTDDANSDNSDLIQVGTYKLAITSNGTNYDFSTAAITATFTITPADQTALTITGTRERVYYGDTIPLGTTGGSSGGSVSWKVSDGAPASIDANGLLKITGTGSVTVTATSSKTGYADKTATWNLYADKKPVTAVVTAAAKTYDGDATATVTATLQASDFVGTDSFTITLTGCTFEDPNAGTDKKVNVDSSNPTFTVGTNPGSTDNHENYAITYPATATASIFKANVDETKVTAPTAAGNNLEYTGLPLTLVTAGTVTEGGTMEYSVDGTNYSTSLPTGTDAGDYDVWYRVKGDGNHNDTAGKKMDAQVTIAPQEVTDPIIEFMPANASYDGAVHKPTVTVKDNNHRVIPTEEYTVDYGSTDWKTASSADVKHEVTVTDKDGGNYTFTAKTVEFTISMMGQNPLSIVGQPGEVRYGDSFTLSTTGGSGTGAVTWTSSDTSVATIGTNGLVKTLKSGATTITATKEADANYGAVSVTWALSVEKKPVTAIVTANDKEYDGNDTATLVITWTPGDVLSADVSALTSALETALSGQFSSADAGDNKAVTITGTAPDSDKYAVTFNTTTTASITAKAATLSGSTPTTLTYTGSAQNLVTGVSATNGDVAYSTDGSYYTLLVPTGTDAGVYPVWYKAQGSGNYKDSEPVRLNVTIQPKTVSSPMIELSPETFEYDGTPKKPDVVVKDSSTVIPPSEYTVSYGNNTAVGTATVTITDNTGGNYTVSGSKTFTITAGAPALTTEPQPRDLTYNGRQQTLVTRGTAVNGHMEYSFDEYDDYSTALPKGTNAEVYEVWYKVVGTDGITETEPESVIAEILPKPVNPTVTVNLTSDPLPYTGSAQKPGVTVVAESETLTQGTDYTVTYSNNTNPGTATVTVTSTGGNYQFTAQTTFEIAKSKAKFLSEPKAVEGLVYTGEEQELVTGGASQDGLVLYSLDAFTFSASIPTKVNKGSYTVYAKVQGGSKYEDSDLVSISVEIGINEVKNPTVELSATSFPYTGSVQKPTVTLSDDDGNVIAATEYRVTYTGDTINPGKYTLTITSRNKNYSFTDIIREITITDASQTPLAITGKQDTVYYGDTLSLGTTGGGSGTVTWSSNDTDVADIGTSTGVVSIKKSGSVTITATKGGSTDTWTFSAKPKPVTATVYAADKVFNGTNAATLTVTLSGLLPGDNVTTVTANGNFMDANAGTDKTVLITGLNGLDGIKDKYTVSYNSTTTASITPKPASVTGTVAGKLSLTYNAAAQELVDAAGVTVEGGSLAYSLGNSSSFDFNVPTGKDVGSYTVYYKVVADGSGNYRDGAMGSVTATISANQDTPTVRCNPSSLPYDGTAKTPTVVVLDSTGQHIIPESEYTVTFDPSPLIAVGKYAITVTDKSGGNYECTSPVTAADAFEIVASSQAPVSITGKPANVYYGDTFYLSATGGTGSGAIQWSIAESSVATINDSGAVTVKGIGSFTVKAYRDASGGYGQSNTDSVTFEAKPKAVTPVVTASDKPYNGNTDAALTASVRTSDLVNSTDNVILTVQGAFASADAGTGKRVDLTTHTVGGTDADKYTINWPDYVTATINRVDAKISGVPAAVANLVADGTPHQLVSAGTTENNIGPVVYCLGQDKDGTYSSDIPTGTDAGTYRVWYKVADSVNYTGVAPAYVDVTIAGATSGGGTGDTGSENGGTETGTGGTTTETTTNADGSTTTKTEDKTTGTVTETTKNTDGSTTVVKTETDGTKTTTVTDQAGNQSETVVKPDGSSETTVKQVDGSTATVNTGAGGKVEAEVTLPKEVVAAAQADGEAIVLPLPAVEAAAGSEAAPVVTVKTGSEKPVKVLIPTTEAKPGTVAVIVNADGTEEVVKSSVSTADGLAVTLSDGATVKLVDNSKTFADVSAGDWAADAVAFASARELFTGTSEATFSPEQPMTRAMMVTVLARFDGMDTTGGTTWYEKGAQWAKDKNISSGSNLNSNITREQLAVMLWRYAGSPASTGGLSSFNDAGSVSGYAQEAMCWAVQTGILIGNGTGALLPQGEASRAEVAQMLKKFIENA